MSRKLHPEIIKGGEDIIQSTYQIEIVKVPRKEDLLVPLPDGVECALETD
jgi:hypothetical protein